MRWGQRCLFVVGTVCSCAHDHRASYINMVKYKSVLYRRVPSSVHKCIIACLWVVCLFPME
jgi:hypothetical protein